MATRDTAAQVVASVDINERAIRVLKANSDHPTFVNEIESLSDDWFSQWSADVWWASPPCQPFTRRGKQGDLSDPRCRPFSRLLERIARLRPPAFAMENVPGFQSSDAAAELRNTLETAGYAVSERIICPTELGIPNRRKRFYLVASQRQAGGRQCFIPAVPTKDLASSKSAQPNSFVRKPLADYLMPLTADQLQECLVPRQQLIQYASAMDIVDVLRPSDVASCFTSAYGRSPVRSGSYVRTEDGVRRLTPTEIVGLLGFPRQFSWPCDVSFRQAWRLAGNSLSVPVVRQVLTPLIDNAASQESALADVRHDP